MASLGLEFQGEFQYPLNLFVPLISILSVVRAPRGIMLLKSSVLNIGCPRCLLLSLLFRFPFDLPPTFSFPLQSHPPGATSVLLFTTFAATSTSDYTRRHSSWRVQDKISPVSDVASRKTRRARKELYRGRADGVDYGGNKV